MAFIINFMCIKNDTSQQIKGTRKVEGPVCAFRKLLSPRQVLVAIVTKSYYHHPQNCFFSLTPDVRCPGCPQQKKRKLMQFFFVTLQEDGTRRDTGSIPFLQCLNVFQTAWAAQWNLWIFVWSSGDGK